HIQRATYSPEGSRILVLQDKSAELWEATTGRRLALLPASEENIRLATFRPDGRHILTEDTRGRTQIWETDGGRLLANLRAQFDLHNSSRSAYSPDGRRILSVVRGTVRISEADTGRVLGIVRPGGPIESAIYSPDAHHVLLVGAHPSGDSLIWD